MEEKTNKKTESDIINCFSDDSDTDINTPPSRDDRRLRTDEVTLTKKTMTMNEKEFYDKGFSQGYDRGYDVGYKCGENEEKLFGDDDDDDDDDDNTDVLGIETPSSSEDETAEDKKFIDNRHIEIHEGDEGDDDDDNKDNDDVNDNDDDDDNNNDVDGVDENRNDDCDSDYSINSEMALALLAQDK
jgi:hypothetical protein